MSNSKSVETVWSGLGMTIVEKQNEFFLHYDSGSHLGVPTTCNITLEESKRIQSSKEEAFKVLRELEQLKRKGNSREVQKW